MVWRLAERETLWKEVKTEMPRAKSKSGGTKRTITRSRNKDGRIRRKRGDTKLKNLERVYGDFSRSPGNTRLDTLRKRLKKSLSKMVS